MSTRWIQPGLRKVYDGAFPNSSFPDAMIEDGAEAFAGYLSSPTNNGKNWTQERLDWFVNAGIGVGMFCEQYETIVLTGYSSANLALGVQCERMANQFQVPDDVPMWYAVDTSPFGYFTEIRESFQAYKDTNHRPLGAYAGSQCIDMLMDEGLVEYGHIPSAASWSETSRPINGDDVVYGYKDNSGHIHNMYITPRAHMRQHVSEDFAGSRIDPNDVLQATPFWFPHEEEPALIPVEVDPEEMLVFMHKSNGAVKAVDEGGYARAISGTEFYGVRRLTLANSYLIPPEDEARFDAWPERPYPGAVNVNIDYAALARAIFDEQARRLAG